MTKRWSLMTTSERSWTILQAHARSCGGPSMTLGPWPIMARDGMGRSPNRPDFPSRTGMLEQAPPAAGAGVALKSRPLKSSTFVAGLDDPTGDGNLTQGTLRAHTSTAQCQPSSLPSLREPLPGISDPWPTGRLPSGLLKSLRQEKPPLDPESPASCILLSPRQGTGCFSLIQGFDGLYCHVHSIAKVREPGQPPDCPKTCDFDAQYPPRAVEVKPKDSLSGMTSNGRPEVGGIPFSRTIDRDLMQDAQQARATQNECDRARLPLPPGVHIDAYTTWEDVHKWMYDILLRI
ncbi:hypothetical protein BKA59DRAFT_550442 [Fusarium tricinctum]|uniref:Uncharacterized protein n=1 Tax=Fusarium tricinctum TaxID=61284 RepID=A0A8K0SBY6_9HYPO|nr:hypothetical protein BKA59DRAFT_550442 [Fusarium tricinctum]